MVETALFSLPADLGDYIRSALRDGDALDLIRWGIYGSGYVARRFAADLQRVDGALLAGVSGRNAATSKDLAKKYEAKFFPDLAALLKSNIQVLYIATPHSNHYPVARAAIEAGKAVLCEKPMTISAEEASSLASQARERSTFLMEAMWTCFLPAIQSLRERIRAGEIGKLQSIDAQIGFQAPFNRDSRLFRPDLGGGALLDLAVYCLALSDLVAGQQGQLIRSQVEVGGTGVDETTSWELAYPNSVTAVLRCTISRNIANEAVILGDRGMIRIPMFWKANEYELNQTVVSYPYEGFGFQLEAAHVMDCLRAGMIESQIVPLSQSIHRMNMIDQIRRAQ